MNKYEKLIEYVINEQEEKARELFHQIVVEKSRSIYENLINEFDVDETMDNDKDQVEDLVDEITDDEMLPEAEDDEEDMDMDMDDESGEDEEDEESDEEDMDMEMDMDDEEGEESDEGMENRIMDLETALDDLKAEFDKLMADEADEPEHADIMGDDDDEMDTDQDMGDDDMSMVREYTEKVTAGHGAERRGAPEGHEVGSGGSVGVHKQGTVASKNNMGGKAFSLGKGSESAPDGQRPHGKAGGFVKPAQEIDIAKRNVNKPGGNKGAQNFYGKKETSYERAHGAEGQTTAGKMSVDTKSLVGGKVR